MQAEGTSAIAQVCSIESIHFIEISDHGTYGSNLKQVAQNPDLHLSNEFVASAVPRSYRFNLLNNLQMGSE